MNRSDWLKNLKHGDRVLMARPSKTTREMVVRLIDDRHICMVDACNPRSDLAHGEVVWLEGGEGPYVEMIFPLDQGVLPAIGGDSSDGRIGGWEAA